MLSNNNSYKDSYINFMNEYYVKQTNQPSDNEFPELIELHAIQLTQSQVVAFPEQDMPQKPCKQKGIYAVL